MCTSCTCGPRRRPGRRSSPASSAASGSCSDTDEDPMLPLVSQITLATLGTALVLALTRLIKGPTLPDRIVAMDLLGMIVVGIIVVLAGSTAISATLDAAIVIALIGFVGTVAY